MSQSKPQRPIKNQKKYWHGYEDRAYYGLLPKPNKNDDPDYVQGWIDADLEQEEQD